MKYTITDTDALYAEYPQFFTTKQVVVLDRKKVTHALKAGFELPGVEIEKPTTKTSGGKLSV